MKADFVIVMGLVKAIHEENKENCPKCPLNDKRWDCPVVVTPAETSVENLVKFREKVLEVIGYGR